MTDEPRETTEQTNPEPAFSAKIRVQREYVMDLAVRLTDMEQLTRVEDKLKKLGFYPVGKQETPAEKFQREMEEVHNQEDVAQTPPVPQGTGGKQLSNIAAGGDTPICPMHNQPMDRITVKGTPYHSYNKKNCSGEGWWGSTPRQQ